MKYKPQQTYRSILGGLLSLIYGNYYYYRKNRTVEGSPKITSFRSWPEKEAILCNIEKLHEI